MKNIQADILRKREAKITGEVSESRIAAAEKLAKRYPQYLQDGVAEALTDASAMGLAKFNETENGLKELLRGDVTEQALRDLYERLNLRSSGAERS